MTSVTVHTPERQRAAARFWTTLLAGGTLLALALWVLVAELLPHEPLAATIGFAPPSVPLQRFQTAYRTVAAQFALWTLLLTSAALYIAWRDTPTMTHLRILRLVQWLLVAVVLAFAAMQIVAWTKSTHYAHALALSKSDVGAAFNERFCETRALELCVHEDELPPLLTVIGGVQAATSSSVDAANAATLAVWLRCRDLLVAHHARLSSEQLALLTTCNATEASDAWCGRHYLSTVTGDVATDLLDSADAPFERNPAVFAALETAWPTRYRRDALLLGAAAVLAVALSWSLTRLGRDGIDGFELIDVKAGLPTSTATAMATGGTHRAPPAPALVA